LTKVLQNLVRSGYLDREGFGRWTTYKLPDVIDRGVSPANSGITSLRQDEAAASTIGSDGTSDGTYDGTTNANIHAGTGGIDDGEYDDAHSTTIKQTDADLWAKLMDIGKPARARRIMSTADLMSIVVRLCRETDWLTRDELGELVGRSGYNLRDRTLATMVSEGRLVLRFPAKNHPNQAYALNQDYVSPERGIG
jgi:hypothetical protein